MESWAALPQAKNNLNLQYTTTINCQHCLTGAVSNYQLLFSLIHTSLSVELQQWPSPVAVFGTIEQTFADIALCWLVCHMAKQPPAAMKRTAWKWLSWNELNVISGLFISVQSVNTWKYIDKKNKRKENLSEKRRKMWVMSPFRLITFAQHTCGCLGLLRKCHQPPPYLSVL